MPERDPGEPTRLRDELAGLPLKARLRALEGVLDDLVIEDAHGVRFSCRSVAEWRRLRKAKPWNEAIADWIGTFQAGDVFYDIGANIGVFSLLAGKLHGSGVPVVAFEAAADTFAALTGNVILNGLATVTPINLALCDTTGVGLFHFRKLGAGEAMHTLGERPSERPAASIPVVTFALDDLLPQLRLPRPTRIKVDVDGSESAVLAGARRTLTSGPCELFLEISPEAAGLRDEVLALGFHEVRRVVHDPATGIEDVLFAR